MSRQYPVPNDLVTAEQLQAVTDGQPKPFGTEAERFAAYHRPVTDLSSPEPGRPPKKGETSFVSEGTWAGIQVFNGSSWKSFRRVTAPQVATIDIGDALIWPSVLPGNANFTIRILYPNVATARPRNKIVCHYIVEPYNPVPEVLLDSSIVPSEVQAATTTWGSRRTNPTARIVPGTDFHVEAGSVVFDPDDEDNDDFTLHTQDGFTSLRAVISVRVENTATAGNRFQVRLFDPVNARIRRNFEVGICVILPGPNNVTARVDDTQVVTALQTGLKPDEPALINAVNALFPLRYFGGTASANATYSTISGTAVESEDFTPVVNQAFVTNVAALEVAVPAQLVEHDEYFIVEVTPTDDNIDWLRRTAYCWIEGNPANPIIILPQSRSFMSDGLDRDIEIPFYVLPSAGSDLSFRYWLDLGTEEDLEPGVDFPDIVADNPRTFIIPAGTSSGTLRIPLFWFNRMASLPEVTNRETFLHIRYEGDALSTTYTDLRFVYDSRASVVRLPQLTAGNSTRLEQHGQLDFPLTLDRPPPAGTTATVDFTTIGLSASPADYDIPSNVPTGVTYHRRPDGEIYGQAAFTASGDDDGTRRVLRLAVVRDVRLEEDERLRIRFTNPVRCQLVRDEATGIIRNDDLPTAVTGVPDLTLRDGQVIGNTMQFEARLSRPASSSVTFDVSTSDGSATAGQDYVAVSARRVVIGAGRQSAFISVGLVPPIGDSAAETFLLRATGLSGNANPVRLTARGVIPAA